MLRFSLHILPLSSQTSSYFLQSILLRNVRPARRPLGQTYTKSSSFSTELHAKPNLQLTFCFKARQLKPVFLYINFVTRIDFSLFKLNRSIICSSRKLMRQKRKSQKFVLWKTALTGMLCRPSRRRWQNAQDNLHLIPNTPSMTLKEISTAVPVVHCTNKIPQKPFLHFATCRSY